MTGKDRHYEVQVPTSQEIDSPESERSVTGSQHQTQPANIRQQALPHRITRGRRKEKEERSKMRGGAKEEKRSRGKEHGGELSDRYATEDGSLLKTRVAKL